MKSLKEQQDDWYNINAPFGKQLGFPDCCIREFCLQPPELLKRMKASADDIKRYEAGCINGKFSGFIPCVFHAKEILAGKITLHSLIKDRDSNFPPFPLV